MLRHPLGPNWAGSLAMVALAVCVGCGRTEQVEHYTVNKPVPFEPQSAAQAAHAAAGVDVPTAEPPAGEPKDRTLAAILPHGEQGWFFKLTGPKDPVAAQAEAFTNLVKSVHFSADGKPEWTLPEGWQQRAGSEIRYATLVIPAEAGPLELSVTELPKPPGDDENYALVNINRWRGQLRLPPIAREQLATESKSIEVAGAQATLVNLLGTAAPNSMGRPPFLSGAADGK
ncbi:MAG: hypothetical protein AB7O59_19360 [Pirellulales bacterium]